ncbi:hypothetical protein [Oceanirhabdus seepicola]|uniref:Uncharacterized protein n=1 Tax=Oceanirhabdus seepicola TaxID=2828781 RepID=A0A9J6P760_9CLOT|nr:hypothetical protein [Oceanirhabdus seepicola]MCM1991645.1 hypothetical protein [Oceanirhabdus seepicola]
MEETNLNEVILNETIPNKKALWDPKNFLVMSVFLSFLPAGILYSLNYGRVGNRKKKNISLVLSLLGFILFIVALIFIPIIIPITMINLIAKLLGTGINIVVGIYLKNNQEKIFKEHIKNGGNKASFVVPILLSIIVWVIIFLLPTPYDSIQDNKVVFDGDEVYYTESVAVEEAEKLGEFLREVEFFRDEDDRCVKIDKNEGIYIFSFGILKEYIDDADILNIASVLCEYLPNEVFNGEEVEVHLCDENFKPLKKINLE